MKAYSIMEEAMVLIKSIRLFHECIYMYYFLYLQIHVNRVFERLREELCLFTADVPDVGRNSKVFMLSFSVSDFRV